MQPIFQIPELRAQILEHLFIPPYPDHHKMPKAEKCARRATLVSLARCCHLFSGEALDILWRSMCDLVPLLRLLPGFTGVAKEVRFRL